MAETLLGGGLNFVGQVPTPGLTSLGPCPAASLVSHIHVSRGEAAARLRSPMVSTAWPLSEGLQLLRMGLRWAEGCPLLSASC